MKQKGWTIKREKFCRLIALQGLDATAAYRRAYDVSPDTKPLSVYQQASKLRNKLEIAERIEALQNELLKDDLVEGKLSLESHLANLKELKTLAVETGQIGAAITAEVQRGKASSLYVERTINADVSLADLVGGGSVPDTKKAPAKSPGPVSKRKRS